MAEYTLAANPFPIGVAAPDFEMRGADGQQYSLSSFEGKDVLVVAFVCNHCPYVVAYWERLRALVAEFLEVQFVGINSNDDVNYPDDSYEKMVELAEREQLKFPYLRDESQDIAKAYHAERTPQVFVFNAERKLVYTGGIDDSCRDAEQVGEQMLRDALLALREGREIEKPEAPSIGCSIKWKH
jgi:peroxiredoxin